MSAPSAPAGWYEDPDVSGQQRYWDGADWTEHTAPEGSAPMAVSAASTSRVKSPLPSWRLARTGLVLIAVAIVILVVAGMIGGATGEELLGDAVPFARIPLIIGVLALLGAGITKLTEAGERS